MDPPLAVDIDGTLTGPDRALDPRALATLQEWDAPVVVATGKALPYPVGLCQFAGLPERAVAENGGVAVTRERVEFHGDREGAQAVVREFERRGYGLGWEPSDFINRWRETELAVSRTQPLEPLREIATEYGLEVVDSGYAYHVKSPGVDKGKALATIAGWLDVAPCEFVAVGDSENDVELFEVVGFAYAVANADERARSAADEVTGGSYGDGFLEAVERIRV